MTLTARSNMADHKAAALSAGIDAADLNKAAIRAALLAALEAEPPTQEDTVNTDTMPDSPVEAPPAPEGPPPVTENEVTLLALYRDRLAARLAAANQTLANVGMATTFRCPEYSPTVYKTLHNVDSMADLPGDVRAQQRTASTFLALIVNLHPGGRVEGVTLEHRCRDMAGGRLTVSDGEYAYLVAISQQAALPKSERRRATGRALSIRKAGSSVKRTRKVLAALPDDEAREEAADTADALEGNDARCEDATRFVAARPR